MEKLNEIFWLDKVDEDNYLSASSYLSLLFDDAMVASIIKKLRAQDIVQFRSKDIFRASQLSLLGVSNARVERDRKKIEKGSSFSPLLLVRDSLNGKVVVADGYHRMCAIYAYEEDQWIHCKIV